MSAYDSMVSDHWVASVTNLPDAARGYFACFALVRNGWDSCLNGSWLLRLALELAQDEETRELVKSVAADVEGEMTSQLERHFADRPSQDDPIRFAYEDAKTELRLSVGPTHIPMLETVVSEADRPIYERSLRTLRRFAADLVRARLPHPIALRADPAFEDTKAIPPSMIPELTRMRVEGDVPGQPPQTQPQPSTLPQGQTPLAPRVVPRPSGGGVRSR